MSAEHFDDNLFVREEIKAGNHILNESKYYKDFPDPNYHNLEHTTIDRIIFFGDSLSDSGRGMSIKTHPDITK